MTQDNRQRMAQQGSDRYTERWFNEESSLMTGLFRLHRGGEWRLDFASADCARILMCGSGDFFDRLMALSVHREYDSPRVTVRSLLDSMPCDSSTVSFICFMPNGAAGQFIKGSMAMGCGQDGGRYVYGQLTDVSSEQERAIRSQDLEQLHLVGMEMTGIQFIHYSIGGRRAFLPRRLEPFSDGPKEIEDFPIRAVQLGYIAEHSIIAWNSFFESIHGGKEWGEAYISLRRWGGGLMVYRMWFARHRSYPDIAVLSFKDVTGEYDAHRAKELDNSALLSVTDMAFTDIVTLNLSSGSCRILKGYCVTDRQLGAEGGTDALMDLCCAHIADENREGFRRTFSAQNILHEFGLGRDSIRLIYSRVEQDGRPHWVESTAARLANPFGSDILAVFITRNVDRYKEREDILRQALIDSEDKLESWMYYNSLSSSSHPGLVYVNYEDGRSSPYVVGVLAKRLACDPKELATATSFTIPMDDRARLALAREEARNGRDDSFQAEYRIRTEGGELVWVHNHAISFVDNDGAAGHIHFLTDTTHEHELMEQLRLRLEERIAENEKVFNIAAQHSDRTLCYYDIRDQLTRPCDPEECRGCAIAHMCFRRGSIDRFAQDEHIMPGFSRDEAARMAQDIRYGAPFGSATLHILMPGGGARWLEFKYSCLYDGEEPASVLISHKDVTESHDNELAKLRLARATDMDASVTLGFLEADLDTDRIEQHTGRNYLNNASFAGMSYTAYCEGGFMGVIEEERAEFCAQYSRERLRELYHSGVQRLNNVWQLDRGGRRIWARILAELVRDPYSGHIKAFARMMDITRESEERIAVQHEAEYDGMTGLLRRSEGEKRIRNHLARHTSPGGILVALDLDDLKGINDNLGHAYGDIAITSVADALKAHFRKDDILIRAGGDEFLVFLPGAAASCGAIELTLKKLQDSLSLLTVGDAGRSIRCSIGCAVELPETDTFDSLYQRADIALYNIKRGGKNGIAFFRPEMLEDHYRHRIAPKAAVRGGELEDEELRHLLYTASMQYPGIAAMNITNDSFRLLCTDSSTSDIRKTGSISEFFEDWADRIHPDDLDNAVFAMSRDELLMLHARGRRRAKFFFRKKEAAGYVRTEADVRFYTPSSGDVAAFVFFRWDSGSPFDRRVQHISKLVEDHDLEGCGHILTVDALHGSCSVYRSPHDERPTPHEAEDFFAAAERITGGGVPDALRPERVLEHMQGPDSRYSCRFTAQGGDPMRADFFWSEYGSRELLMAVSRLSRQ